ncbi:MAG: hypothetical protein ACOH14_14255 [Rhodoglobus sp.]
MSATRFDPKDGVPYARCLTEGCGFVADTKEQMSTHSAESMTPTGAATGVTARGHSYRVENPSRADALRSEVMREADDALDSALTKFVDSVFRLHRNDGVPLADLTEAVKSASPSHEWGAAWAEYIEDEVEEDDEADSGDGLGQQLHQETALFGPEVVNA